MTWPIVEGVSLLHLHVNRGKRVARPRPQDAGGGRGVQGAGAQRRRRHRGACAPACSTSAASATSGSSEVNPAIVFCTHLGLRRDRSRTSDLPSPRHRVRHVGRRRRARSSTTTASADIPSTRRSASTPGPLFGALGILAAHHPRARRRARAACMEVAQSDAAAYFDWYRIETLQGLRAPAVGGHRQRVRRLRAPRRPASPGMRRGRALPDLRVGGRPRAVHGVGAGVLEELLRGHRPHGPVREVAGQRSIADHARGNVELQASCATIFKHEDHDGVARRSRNEHNTTIAPVNTPKTIARRPAVPGDRLTWISKEQLGAEQLPSPIQVDGEELPVPHRGADRRAAHRRSAARRARLRRRPARAGARRRARSVSSARSRQTTGGSAMGRLDGKVAIVTGAAPRSGRGRGAAVRRARARRSCSCDVLDDEGEAVAERHRRRRRRTCTST